MSESRGTLAAQLAPFATRLRESQGLVRPISQVLLTAPAADPAETIESVRKAVLRWIEGKAGRRLPQSAWDGESFELADVGAQPAEAVRLDGYWAARVVDADKNVARRSWVAEIAIGGRADEVLFGARLASVTRGDDAPGGRSVPSFVREIARVAEFRIDGRRVDTAPWVIASRDDVVELIGLLLDRSRRHPVSVFSLRSGSNRADDTIVPVEPLLRRTIGAAHIAVLEAQASFHLTDLLGKEFSVFDGAIRTYRPGFDPDASDPGDHPLALRTRIEGWPGGPDRFVDFLVEATLRATVVAPDLETALPPYARIKQVAQEAERRERAASGASAQELLEMAIAAKERLERYAEDQKRTYDDLLQTSERERTEARGQLHEAESRISALTARIDHLEKALASSSASAEEEPPDDFAGLEAWARRNLAGSVVILNRAIRAAKKSPFEDVGLAYRALLLLRDRYAPMKRGGGPEARRAYEAALDQLHLEDAPCFSGAGAGEFGDAYFVDFGGRQRELDRHLKGSNSRDPRAGFRLYFFWDDATGQVVVGWLPNHLETRAT